jgi:hypothetical protein
MEINKEKQTITLSLEELEKMIVLAENEKTEEVVLTCFRLGRNFVVTELINKIKGIEYESN